MKCESCADGLWKDRTVSCQIRGVNFDLPARRFKFCPECGEKLEQPRCGKERPVYPHPTDTLATTLKCESSRPNHPGACFSHMHPGFDMVYWTD
jgi:hypothetical protein